MLLAALIIFAVFSLLLLGLAGAAFRRKRYMGSFIFTLSGLLFLAISALSGTIGIATRGYRALTREETAIRIITEPIAPHRFRARVIYPDGSDTTYSVTGDQVYVDAHILKWKPIANFLGLHTAYELDRIGGRYVNLVNERDSVRAIFSLKQDKPIDMFALRTRYALLAPFLDAEYGSGTFIAADRLMEYEVRVSTTGLLIRPVESR